MKFTIGFEKEDKKTLYSYFDKIFETQKWSEGIFTQKFEEEWGKRNGTEAVAFGSWSGAALAALEYYQLRGKTVLCPSNTFMATPLVNKHLGCRVEFVDCNKEDLCLSLEHLKEMIQKYRPHAVWVVHIGGHIAFNIKEIADLCNKEGVVLLEDCAHAHGASWGEKSPGTWGDAGFYSFYATKTISTGEGGMLVSRDKGLADFARKFRNYGKFDYDVDGLNFRVSEFTAAIGCVQAARLSDIVAWKNEYALKHLDSQFSNRVKFPDGMVSGYYKYIVFEELEKSTGRVYDQPCHKLMKKDYALPNTEWIAQNHWCAPLYYKGTE